MVHVYSVSLDRQTINRSYLRYIYQGFSSKDISIEEKPLFNIYSFFRLITNEDRNERMMTDESHNPSDHD